jgi:hypothetical protein
LEGNKLVVEVFYTFHKEQLEQERHLQILEKVSQQIFNEPVLLRFVLGDRVRKAVKQAEADVANITGKVEDEKVVEAVEEIFGK